MSLNQSAPAAEAPKAGTDYVKLEPFPKSDTVVLTVVAYNYIEKCEFERTDDKGVKSTEIRPGLEFYFGTLVGNKPYFVKPWPIAYSLHEKANYAKWYEAATGNVVKPGTKPDDMIGKFVLGNIKVESKVGQKGTAYKISKIATITPVPSILASTGTPLEVLRRELDKALAAQAGGAAAKDEGVPF